MTGLSFQLYTARDVPDLPAFLVRLAGFGYAHVEGYGGVIEEPAALLAGLEAAGLTMPSCHVALDRAEEDPDGTVAVLRSLGVETVVFPHLAPEARPDTAEGWDALGARLERAAAPYLAAGFRVAWHNHDFEVAPLPDGTTPLARILAAAPSLLWEGDLAWVARGGGDPLAWIEAERGRLVAVHVKDLAPPGENEDEDGWADIGRGVLPWPALMAALSGAPEPLFVVEHDRPRDPAAFAERAAEAVRAMRRAAA